MPRTGARGGPQTRARIAEVAARLFLERGFDAVTVAEVAREAGVSSVTVFNHFPRKEDLFLDRAVDAVELLRSAVRDRGTGVDVLASLRDATLRLVDDRHPLSGLERPVRPVLPDRRRRHPRWSRGRGRSPPTSSGPSPRSSTATRPSSGDGTLLAAFFIAGYATVLVETARRRIAGEPPSAVLDDHRARLERLFDALRGGVLSDD